jgi:hypothetical protein
MKRNLFYDPIERSADQLLDPLEIQYVHQQMLVTLSEQLEGSETLLNSVIFRFRFPIKKSTCSAESLP